MFAALPLSYLIPIFIISSVAVWIAGVQLSNVTDIIDRRFNLGEALGGMIFLAIATNLPEIAIVISASLAHSLEIAIGNILGGIAIQTVVLALLDGYGLRRKFALTYVSASPQLMLEGILVIIVLVISIMGAQLPQSVILARLAPGDVSIAIVWLAGLWMVSKARTGLPWREKNRVAISHALTVEQKKRNKRSTIYVISIFLIAALVTLVAGALLEESGRAIAKDIGWSGVVFGSTILAAVTSLPEVSTGLAAIKMRDYTLAFSDIFGGNAFLPVLFLPATLISGQSLLPQAQKSDIYLASLGVLLTAIYLCGILFRPKRQFYCLGIDSLVVVLVYLISIGGLFFI